MKRFLIGLICFSLVFGLSNISYSIEPTYILQIFNQGDYPTLISDTHNILFENFTATWCGWCHYSYEIFDALREKYGTQIINIRYHNQDELVMSNITERSGFYKVNGFPTMVFNGNHKIIGADETTYPAVEELVSQLMETQAKLGIYSTGYMDGNTIRMTTVIQSFSQESLEGNFLSVFTENNVLDQKQRRYDYVSRSVFPSFKGLKLTIEPKKIYIIQYTKVVTGLEKILDFEVVSFFQNFTTREVYNSSTFQMDTLTIAKSYPASFDEGFNRDKPIVLEFQEGLVLGSIETAKMMVVSNKRELIFLDSVYDRNLKTLTLYPSRLLEPESGYFFIIQGGNTSLLSVNKKRLKSDFIIPFRTSAVPDLKLSISTQELDFGEIFDIDYPETTVLLQEQKGLPMRFKFVTSAKWIECSEQVFQGSSLALKVKANPLFMHMGANTGFLTITTILGTYTISVQANLLNNEYPQIRLYNYYPWSLVKSVVIYGRTNGYRVFINEKEIYVDNDGYFKNQFLLSPGYNLFMLKSMNMQRKFTTKPILIYSLLNR